ncbi:hypothetical protein K440DRAFT_614272 [Wilcoxina mikolae CBS 423.85]|nr:hypothetical protein K440DRAFT_632162 [Wilcoxina mikolae CBS 423.85]KAF8251303.1 hypothetical protein K440DRAFT_614272 [Wilcoxina mikolae CBS 423.85]
MNRRLADQDVRSERELQALKEEKQKAEQQLEAIQEQQMLLETKFVAQSETAERLKEQLEQEKARMEANIRGRSRKPWSQMGMSYSTLMAFLISTVLICWVVEGRAVQTIAPTLGLRYLSAFIFFWWKQFYDDSPDATGVLAVFFYVLWRVYATWRQGGLAVADIFRLVPLAVTCCIFLFSLSGNLVMPRHGCGSFQETK